MTSDRVPTSVTQGYNLAPGIAATEGNGEPIQGAVSITTERFEELVAEARSSSTAGIDASPNADGTIDSAGGHLPAVVVGADNRVQVNVNSTPYSQVVLIMGMSFTNDYVWSCTGYVYGPDDIVTAGHCISPSAIPAGQVQDDMMIYIKANGFDFISQCVPTHYAVHNLWLNNRNRQYDYGYLKVSCSAGLSVGSMGIANNEVISGSYSVTGVTGQVIPERTSSI